MEDETLIAIMRAKSKLWTAEAIAEKIWGDDLPKNWNKVVGRRMARIELLTRTTTRPIVRDGGNGRGNVATWRAERREAG